MAEILFYHLTEKPLENVLPGLLEKCLQRDWKVVIQAKTPERLTALDGHLWSWSAEAFLPHGMAKGDDERDSESADHPIWLTCAQDNPNAATIRFMVEGAEPPDLEPYERGIYIFDGHNAEELSAARSRWKVEKDAGHQVTYWQQNPNGGWEKKA